ncbi:MAG: hypothetical protein ABDH21_06025 [bacterium]
MIVSSRIIDQVLYYLNNLSSATFAFIGQSKKLKLSIIEKVSASMNQKLEKYYLIEDDTIPIDMIRYVLNLVKLKSTDPRLVVIDLDNINIYSMNAMLKTLEEPPNGVYFFLLKKDTNIIPTILSRSIKIHLNVEKSGIIEYLIKSYNYTLNWAEFVTMFTNGDFDLISYFSENFWDSRNKSVAKNFGKIFQLLIDQNLEVVFDEEFWVKNFSTFSSYRILLCITKAFFRDILFLKYYKQLHDQDLLKNIEKNLIFTKVFDMEYILEKTHRRINCKITPSSIFNLFDRFNRINSNSIFKRINKRILYFGFGYLVYNYLRGGED